MSSVSTGEPRAAVADARVADPLPLLPSRAWTRWLGTAMSVAILVAVVMQMRALEVHRLVSFLPRSPAFWLVFAGAYLAGPLSELLIFRRLWNLPWRGLGPLLRKQVCNEILLGYSGEVYFYAWARRNADLTAAPFGAIKDVTILSALAGNIFALAMTLLAVPIVASYHLGFEPLTLKLSLAFVVALTAVPIVLGRRLFSVSRDDLRLVFGIHVVRIVVKTVLSALMWHLVMPGVSIGMWFLLSTLRQLVSRLPLIPNKEAVLAGFAVILIGRDSDITALLAMMAGLLLLAHCLVGAALGARDLARDGAAA